jgi:hypothetical protein
MSFGTGTKPAAGFISQQPTAQAPLTLGTVQEEVRYPDLDQGQYVVTLEGIPEQYQSNDEQGRPLGHVVKTIVKVHAAQQGSTTEIGKTVGVRIKGFGVFHDNADMQKTSGARALIDERSLLLAINNRMGQQVPESELLGYEQTWLAGGYAGKPVIINVVRKVGRVSQKPYFVNKFLPYTQG